MSDIYHEGNRQLQDQFDTRRLANRLDEAPENDPAKDESREVIDR